MGYQFQTPSAAIAVAFRAQASWFEVALSLCGRICGGLSGNSGPCLPSLHVSCHFQPHLRQCVGQFWPNPAGFGVALPVCSLILRFFGQFWRKPACFVVRLPVWGARFCCFCAFLDQSFQLWGRTGGFYPHFLFLAAPVAQSCRFWGWASSSV